MNDCEEDLDGFPFEKEREAIRIYGWSISRRVERLYFQQEVASQRRFYLSQMDRRPELSTSS